MSDQCKAILVTKETNMHRRGRFLQGERCPEEAMSKDGFCWTHQKHYEGKLGIGAGAQTSHVAMYVDEQRCPVCKAAHFGAHSLKLCVLLDGIGL